MQLRSIDTAPNPTRAIIVMHGLGADSSDFVPFAGQLDLSALGGVRFIFPAAPVVPVTINGGYAMPAWYDILGTDLVRQEDESGLRASRSAIDTIIEAEIGRGIRSDRIVVGGFSQGCAMALMVGLRQRHRLGGILGMSGYLPLASLTEAERNGANHDTPIFLAHGTQDPVVPYARAVASRDALKVLGHPVEWHEYPMPHSVCPQEVADIEAWLLRVLA